MKRSIRTRSVIGVVPFALLLCLIFNSLGHAQTSLWNQTGSMLNARILHTATLLPGGKVLVAGGLIGCNPSCTPTNSVEIYDPATGTWRATAGMRLPRANHAAVLLRDGKVLVAGGTGAGGAVTSVSELYDPESETWSTTGSLTEARQFLQATPLSDGRVLMTG